MPHRTTTPARWISDFAFRELLTHDLGWIPTATSPLRVTVGQKLVELDSLGEHHGRVALQHQTPIGASIPDYVLRRAIRAAAAEMHPDPVIVFSDVLRTAQVWQWVERGRTNIYREHAYRPGDDPSTLIDALLRLNGTEPVAATCPNSNGAHHENVATLILPALLRRVRRSAPAAFRAGGIVERQTAEHTDLSRAVLNLIEEADDPALLRASWRSLRELAVLDPACGTGERLFAALDVLTPIYDACLERMGSWVADLDRARIPHRPEKLADFRTTLDRAQDIRRHPDRRHFIVHSILLTNLYAVDPRPETIRACRELLVQELNAGTGLHKSSIPPEPNLRTGDVAAGFSTAAELRLALGNAPGAEAQLRRLGEEAEALERTRTLLRRMRDREDGDPEHPAESTEVADRLERLRAEMDALVASRLGIPRGGWRQWRDAHRPVHLWLEFHGIISRGGFDVVLGTPARVKEATPERDPGAELDYSTPATHPTLPMNPDACATIPKDGAAYPSVLTGTLGDEAPEVLTARGNHELLRRPALAIFCSVRVPGDLILRMLDLARELRDRGIATIGGFHSPVERECLTFLLRGRQPVIVSPARSLERMRLPAGWREPLEDGRLLLISRFADKHRRPTTRMTEARNLMVGALADGIVIAHAMPGGRTYRLARRLLECGKPVFTFDVPHNRDLFLLGARPVPPAVAEMLGTRDGEAVADPAPG